MTMASSVFLSTWMVAFFLLMLVYITQGNGCKCGIVGAFKATCPNLDKSKCDKTLVAKNLNQCRRNCAGKRSNIESLLNTGENNGQYRGQKAFEVAMSEDQ
ncbi:uncharacterized protein [Amphiura filiformis]|uniref:uncharacterized protein isoform X2 n=1 Tax=Amphiura filiformis TaxID=82378 RepID=UPI003B213462